jgi:LPS export ABC transporter protein LptC
MARLSNKSLPLIGVVILFAVIGFFLVRTDTEESEKMIPNVTVPKADISSENFKVTETDPDKGTKLTLEADEGSYSNEKDGEIGSFKGFRLTYQTKETLDFELEGMNGEFDRAKNEINLSGGLKGKTGDGYLIYTERITIQQNENCIKSDEAVTVEGPFFRITGKGLFMDLEKKTLKILKDVNSVFDTEAINI